MRHCIWRPRGDVDARAHGRPWRQCGRHDGAQRAGGGGGVRGLRLVVRGHRPDGAGGDHARLRGPLHRPADRAAARGRAGSTRSVRPSTAPAPCRARSCSSREPRTPWSRRHRPRACAPPSRAAGTTCDLEFFEGEGHGFRRADTLTACLEAELAFYLAGTSASRIERGGSFTATPCVRGFCDAMPNDSTTTPPSWAAPLVELWQRVRRPHRSGSPRSWATRCSTGSARSSRSSPSTPRPTRSTRSGGAWRCCPSSSAPWPRACWPGPCAAPAGGNPASALTTRQHQRAWVTRIVGGGLRVRRLARHSRSASRSCGGSTAWPDPTCSPRSPPSRSGVRTSSTAQDPYIPLVRLHHAVQVPRARRAGLRRLPAVPAAHGRRRHSERDLAEQRAERRADLLLPDHARRGRGRALPVPGRRATQDPRHSGAHHPPAGRRCRWPPEATTSRSWRSCSWPWCWPNDGDPSPRVSSSASRRP